MFFSSEQATYTFQNIMYMIWYQAKVENICTYYQLIKIYMVTVKTFLEN